MDAAFVADICEQPEDDAPRLIYADWLDDHGQEARAEFIRVQCELARLDPYDARRPALVRRERALWVDHGRQWRKAVAPVGKRHEFRRGFVHRVALDIGVFTRRAEALFAAHPLRELRALDVSLKLDDLTASPHLARLRGLELGPTMQASDAVGRLAASPHVGGLEAFALHGVTLHESATRALLTSAHLGALTALRLGQVSPTAAAVACDCLGIRHGLRSLTRLDLGSNHLTPQSLPFLARCDRLEHLVELSLALTHLSDAGVRDLVASRRLRSLQSLDLSNIALTSDGVRLLAGCPELTALRHLNLEGNFPCLQGGGVRALADSAALANLRSLGLLRTEVETADILPTLLRAAFLPGLRQLSLSAGSPNTARGLFETAALANVWTLSFMGFGTEGVALLNEVASATFLTSLTHLSVVCRHLDAPDRQAQVAEAVARLANAPHLAGLVALTLLDFPFGEAAYRALIDSPYLPRWCRVDLGHRPPAALRQALRERFAEVSPY